MAGTTGPVGDVEHAAEDVANAATGGVAGSLTGFLSALEQPVKAAMWLVDPGNWARIIAGLFGFLLLTAGLITLGMSA